MSKQSSKAKRKIVLKLAREHGFICHYCHRVLEWYPESGPKIGMTIKRFAVLDHIVPRSKGGKNNIENLVLSCTSCNCKKCKMDYQEFIDLGWAPYDD